MNKLLILAAILSFDIGTAAAKVTAITDWSDTMGSRTNTPKEDSITCAEKCPGYDVTTTYCYTMGETLESCPEKGCSYYHRCVPNQ